MATIQEAIRLLRIQARLEGGEEAKRALDALSRAQQQVGETSRETERATQTMERRLQSIKTRYDENFRAQQQVANVERDLQAIRARGLISLSEQNRLMGLANAQILRTGTTTAAAAGSFGAMRHQIQNAAFQFGDLFTQIASGQGVIRPLIQQGTQFVSIWGAAGAIVGAAGAALGALAIAFMGTGDAAEDASPKLETWVDKLERARDAMDDINKRGARTADSIAAENRAIISELQKQIALVDVSVQADIQERLRQLGEADVLARTIGQGGGGLTPDAIDALNQRSGRNNTRQRANALAAMADLGAFDDGRKYFGQRIGTPFDYKGDLQDQEAATEKAARELAKYNAEVMRIGDAWLRATDQSRDAAQKLVDRLDPLGAATRKLEEDQATLLVAMANGIEITGGYAKAFADLEAGGEAFRQLTEEQEKQRRSLDAEIATLGMSAEARAVYIARLEAEERLRAKQVPMTTEGAQAYIEEAGAIAKSNAELRRRQADIEAGQKLLEGLFTQSFDRIGSGITEALATGQIEMAKFGDIGRAVISELIQLAIQLSVINPIKNWATGGNDATISSVFSLIQTGITSLFGGGSFYGSGNTVAAGSYAGGGTAAFANGGSFVVPGAGGTDSQMVRFRATPGERVTVTRPDQSIGGGVVVNFSSSITVQGGAGGDANASVAAELEQQVREAARAAVREEFRHMRRANGPANFD